MRYIKTGWYSGVREGRFLITRRVDQPFSLVLALPLFPLSGIHSFSIYFLFPLCLSCIVSASTVKLSFSLCLSLCNLRRWNFFSFCLSLYCLRRWSDISPFFISLRMIFVTKELDCIRFSLSLSLLVGRPIQFVSSLSLTWRLVFVHLFRVGQPLSPCIFLPQSTCFASFFFSNSMRSSLCYLRTESNYTFVAVPFPLIRLSLSWPDLLAGSTYPSPSVHPRPLISLAPPLCPYSPSLLPLGGQFELRHPYKRESV